MGSHPKPFLRLGEKAVLLRNISAFESLQRNDLREFVSNGLTARDAIVLPY